MGAGEPTASVMAMETRFASLSEYLAGTAELGWEQEFRQLDRGSGPASVKIVASKVTQLIRVEYSNLTHQRILPPAGCLNFGILACEQAPIKLGAKEVSADSLMYFDREHGLDAVVQPGFCAHTLSFDKEHLCDLAQRHELPIPDGKPCLSTSARNSGVARASEIRELIREAFVLARFRKTAPLANEAMQFTLPRLVLQSWYDTAEPSAGRPGNRSRALSIALDYIDSHAQQAISVEQLCLVSASSISTLERAFKDQFGVSPKRYLVASRLCGSHRALLNRDDHRTVTEIAFDWSFWHMGKFASDYKKMFGQLPSETHYQRRVA